MTQDRVFILVDIACCVIFTFYVMGKGILVHRGAILLMISSAVWLFLVNVVNNDPAYSTYLALVISFYLTFITANAVPFEQFKNIFNKIVLFFAFVSLIFFFLQPLLSEHYSNSTIITNNDTAHYYNLWIWVSHLDAKDRNFGVFWEPGAYQVFLNLALLFILTSNIKNSRKALECSVLTVAILTTYSTTGYISCVLIYGAMLFNHKERITIPKFVLVVLGFLLLFYSVSALVVNNPIIVSKFREGQTNYGSFKDRYNATLMT
jgi:hypothetical protein